MTQKRDSLLIVCTDKGQHQSAQVGRIDWTPDFEDGAAVWTPGEDDAKPESIAENTRQTRAGKNHVTNRNATVSTRADGGTTFTFACPRCQRETRRQSEWVDKLRNLPGVSTDISLWPMQ